MKFEDITCAADLQSYLHEIASSDDIASLNVLIEDANVAGVKVRYEITNINELAVDPGMLQNPNNTEHYDTASTGVNSLVDVNAGFNIGRIILSRHRGAVQIAQKPIQSICNGVVIRLPSWNICCVPPQSLEKPLGEQTIVDNLRSYEIFKMMDGTMITLYCEDGEKWSIATANGFDVGHYEWLGKTTYSAALEQVAAAYAPEFDMNKLDTNYCYSFVFRHADFHPFRADIPGLWLVQRASLKTFDIEQTYECKVDGQWQRSALAESLGVRAQIKLSFDDFCTRDPRESERNNNIKVLSEINKKCKSALGTYRCSNVSATKNNSYSDENTGVFYGYIFRSGPGSSVVKNFAIESTLFKRIKNFVYRMPKGKALPAIISGNDRKHYLSIRAYMNVRDKGSFKELFPNLHEYFLTYDELVERIFESLKASMNNRTNKANESRQAQFRDVIANGPESRTADAKITILVENLMKYIRENLNIKRIDKPESENIVRSIITSEENTPLFYEIITTPAK